MPVADFLCSKCNREDLNVFYKVSTLDQNAIQCSNCKEIGGMEIRYNQAGPSVSYSASSKGDIYAQTPSSFKEVLGAIKNGVAKGKVGKSFDKY